MRSLWLRNNYSPGTVLFTRRLPVMGVLINNTIQTDQNRPASPVTPVVCGLMQPR